MLTGNHPTRAVRGGTGLDILIDLLRPPLGPWYTAVVRVLFPVLAGLILFRAIRSLLTIPHTPETWGQLSLPGGGSIPLTHWENILGRGRGADVRLNYPSISRQHAALCRGDGGQWTLYDLGSKGGAQVNGETVEGSAPVSLGDTVTLGGVPLLFLPQTAEERKAGGPAEGGSRRRLALLPVADPVPGVGLPAIACRSRNQEQYNLAYRFASEWKNGLSLMLLLETGISRSELLGLRWEDIDEVERSIHINQGLVVYHSADEGKEMLGVQRAQKQISSVYDPYSG